MENNVELEGLLGRVFDRSWSEEALNAEDYAARRRDFVFHMTDWTNDLGKLSEMFKNPGQMTDETASRLLIGFMYHAIPHLNAAGRIFLDENPSISTETKKSTDVLQLASHVETNEIAATQKREIAASLLSAGN